jgi:sugar lactone lactonase YvrE
MGQAPTIGSQPISRTVWTGSSVKFDVTASGLGPVNYEWRLAETNLPEDIISTVVGGAFRDGVLATNASVVGAVAMDPLGDLFIADTLNNRVRKVDTNGTIHLIAGNGAYGFSGDGGAATNASFNVPMGIALDKKLNIFIADFKNSRIRKIDANGIVSTVAGNGTNGFSGDGGPATNASLYYPASVAVDTSGNLLIADEYNNRIRRVNTNGVISTVAGKDMGFSGDHGPATNAALSFPAGIAIDGSGNLWIADTYNDRIRRVDTNGTIITVAGSSLGYYCDGCPATGAPLYLPFDVAVDVAGRFFLADYGNNRVRMVDTNGIITTVAGNGIRGSSGDGVAATNASLYSPGKVALDNSGNVYFTDNLRIRKVGGDGLLTTVAGGWTGDGGQAVSASLARPVGVCAGTSGDLFITDLYNNRVRRLDTNGIIAVVAGNGTTGLSGDGGPATNASLTYPYASAADGFGNVFIADQGNNRVRRVGADGVISTLAKLSSPYGVAADAAGNVFVSSFSSNCVYKVDTNGMIAIFAGTGTAGFYGDGGAATNANLSAPWGLSVDASGNLFIADYGNGRIRRVDTSGMIATVAGGGSAYGDDGAATNAALYSPRGVAIDSCGNLFIGDRGDFRIRKVDTNGIITTVAGNGAVPFPPGGSGDGGRATNASLSNVWGLTLDTSGDLLIADYDNDRIRKVTSTRSRVLSLNSVIARDGGDYSVVVGGPGGSVTSSIATLTVAASPIIYKAALMPGGGVNLKFVGRPISSNVLLCATNLIEPVFWRPLSTGIAGGDGDWQYLDVSATNSPSRFYRLLSP